MIIYPTRTAAHLAIAAGVAFVVGIAMREPWVVAWGGGLLVGVAFARAATLVSVMRIRAAGFEMLWCGNDRVVRLVRGTAIVLAAEIRNRDTLGASFDNLRALASPSLEVIVRPRAGEVKATGSVKVEIEVRARRVGFHAIHSLALEVRGAPGSFEVPLTFANSFGVEVMPRLQAPRSMRHRGGPSGLVSASGHSARRRGDGSEIFELRELVAGDALRRIAWKASAKRGKLIVREMEREECDVVMLVLDASVELWAGVVGAAPLDDAIDVVAGLARHHLARGNPVGLRIVAARELARVRPRADRGQSSRLHAALVAYTGVFDHDRSALNETELAAHVVEHMRPLDARSFRDLRHGRFDKLAERSARLRANAPFLRLNPLGLSSVDSELRRYAASFGLALPARYEPEREHTAVAIAKVLAAILAEHSERPSVVHIVAPPPPAGSILALGPALKRLGARNIELRWSIVPLDHGLGAKPHDVDDAWSDKDGRGHDRDAVDRALFDAMTHALSERAKAATRASERALQRLGVRLVGSGSRPSLGAEHGAGEEAHR
ncbi:MAG: DUF58 domain-containing protein [Myxococcales bacterium]|nr:DUF58 domain-containing protein [Myxococcales bacterium]